MTRRKAKKRTLVTEDSNSNSNKSLSNVEASSQSSSKSGTAITATTPSATTTPIRSSRISARVASRMASAAAAASAPMFDNNNTQPPPSNKTSAKVNSSFSNKSSSTTTEDELEDCCEEEDNTTAVKTTSASSSSSSTSSSTTTSLSPSSANNDLNKNHHRRHRHHSNNNGLVSIELKMASVDKSCINCADYQPLVERYICLPSSASVSHVIKYLHKKMNLNENKFKIFLICNGFELNNKCPISAMKKRPFRNEKISSFKNYQDMIVLYYSIMEMKCLNTLSAQLTAVATPPPTEIKTELV